MLKQRKVAKRVFGLYILLFARKGVLLIELQRSERLESAEGRRIVILKYSATLISWVGRHSRENIFGPASRLLAASLHTRIRWMNSVGRRIDRSTHRAQRSSTRVEFIWSTVQVSGW